MTDKLNGTPLNSTFDYVICGAGSAGCVLANRLLGRRPPACC